ncbi:MAG: hypothetical protein H7A51_13180 [Akkermansiaceae bacterium]|nr:hypothetical protein [Akkermansiaceae bacterium]
MTRTKTRRPHVLVQCCLFMAAIGLIISSFPVAAAYRPPDMEKKIFNPKEIQLNKFDRAGLVGALVSVARDFNEEDHKVEYDTRSYALAIAGRLDQDSIKVKDCLEQLKSSGDTIEEDGAEKKRTASRLYSGIRSLVRKKDNKDNQTCAAYCVDIALQFDPDGEKADKLKEIQGELSKAGFKANWKGLLKAAVHHNNNPWSGGPQEFTEVEREMPGGTAKKFARKQTKIIGLSVSKLASGKHAGSALPIRLTALEEEGQEGILFKFDQKVGPMMAGSIEEVIKFFRVRYDKDKRPSGVVVDITLGDKGLVDGPSAGTAFALAVDSLFTGDEIDPAYAVTGTITSDGDSGVIGGVAGKIRGAINKDCKIVGIPHGNAKGVYDSYLLDGPAPLLKINVFTQKNFDDAYKLSRVEKSSEIVTAMETYQIVADLVQESGLSVLKDAKVQEQLKKVLENAPNHLSAKVLLEVAQGKVTNTLSLRGTLDEIDQEMSAFGYGGLGEETKATAKESVAHLDKIKDKIDKRMEAYHTAATTLCKALQAGQKEGEEKEAYAKRIRSLFGKASAARGKILGDPKIVEEMNS